MVEFLMALATMIDEAIFGYAVPDEDPDTAEWQRECWEQLRAEFRYGWDVTDFVSWLA